MAFTGRTEDGRAVSYTDRKRHLYFFSLFLPMVPTLSVIGFLLTGNVLMTLVPEGEALVAALYRHAGIRARRIGDAVDGNRRHTFG